MLRFKKQPAGVTLIELTIAISIFSVVMMIAFDSFLNVLKHNREAVNKQSIQDHSEFLFSLMSKEIRTAKINYNNNCQNYFSGLTDPVSVGPNDTYAVANSTVANNGGELRFENYEGLCVRYFSKPDMALGVDRLKIIRYNPSPDKNIGGLGHGEIKESWVLPTSIEITNINFKVQNKFDQRPAGPAQPPLVRFFIGLRSSIWNPSDIKLFNEIEGRNIEQF